MRQGAVSGVPGRNHASTPRCALHRVLMSPRIGLADMAKAFTRTGMGVWQTTTDNHGELDGQRV